MPVDHDDPYVTVNCTICGLTANAVKIEGEDGAEHWIPRSCLHGSDDGLLASSVGDPVQLRVRRWKAESEGMI